VSENDDIDFFIICRSGTLWTTRFFSILLLEVFGRRRRPGDNNFKDKICLNMLVDEEGMAVPELEQDIYTAQEIGNLKVLWEREGSYRRFLEANNWIYKISKLKAPACSRLERQRLAGRQNSKLQPKTVNLLTINYQLSAVNLFEVFFRWLQLKYMSGRRTREKIEPHRLMFHPKDKRAWVLSKYHKLLRSLKV
jgi:hypothetical protein